MGGEYPSPPDLRRGSGPDRVPLSSPQQHDTQETETMTMTTEPNTDSGTVLTELAFASSERPEHLHREGVSCQACRWFEVTIARGDDDRYHVSLIGRTAVPGETDRVREEVMRSPHAVVDLLTITGRDGRPHIPWASRKALQDAAWEDPDIGAALDDFDGVQTVR